MRKSATQRVNIVKTRRKKVLRRLRRKKLRQKKLVHEREKQLLKMGQLGGKPAIVLAAPKRFQLSGDDRNLVVEFLRTLVKLTITQNRVVCINFHDTIKCNADGMLLFFAEVMRILKSRPNNIRCYPPKDAIVKEVLSHLGLLQQMRCRFLVPSSRADVNNWQVFSGIQADATKGVGQAIEKLDRLLTRNQVSKLFRSVSEALTNVTQHAYIQKRQDGTGDLEDRSWWMFVREEADTLTIMFCDLGVGVPYTVPIFEKHSGWLNRRLQDVLRAVGISSHNDAEIIQVTVEEKRSRFKVEHRGNGFGNMIETICAAGEGNLTIHSNRGAYQFQRRAKVDEQYAVNFQNSIYGTVVGWHIKLSEEMA